MLLFRVIVDDARAWSLVEPGSTSPGHGRVPPHGPATTPKSPKDAVHRVL